MIVADFGLARIVSQSHTNATLSTERRRYGSKRGIGGRRYERKKRYTVVGNPYWMAPEMMKGNKYDEKVDVFSFGIVLCEVSFGRLNLKLDVCLVNHLTFLFSSSSQIIGRVHADPDYLPRSSDFSLNQSIFREKFCSNCPEPFYRLAFLCCDLNPDKR